jgi:hypothetical protein
MKNTEAMDLAPKSTELALANDETGGLEMPADQRRRRLVRGVAAFAPVVLTLRSGALAAASCTGARIVDIPSTGPSNGKFTALPGEVACVATNDYSVCANHPLTGLTKIDTKKTTTYPVAGPDNNGLYRCSVASGPDLRGNVAILSSASAGSLV